MEPRHHETLEPEQDPTCTSCGSNLTEIPLRRREMTKREEEEGGGMSVSHIDVSMNAPILHLRPRKKGCALHSSFYFFLNIGYILNKSVPTPSPILRSDFNCYYFLLVVSSRPCTRSLTQMCYFFYEWDLRCACTGTTDSFHFASNM